MDYPEIFGIRTLSHYSDLVGMSLKMFNDVFLWIYIKAV